MSGAQSNKRGFTEEERQAFIRKGYTRDPVWFLRTVFPDKFTSDIPWMHRGIIALLTGKTDFLLKYGELDKIVRHFVWQDPLDPNAEEKSLFTPALQ